MQLHDLKPAPGANHRSKRVGRGIGSGNGGEIRINRGRYIINMSGQSGVGIGSVFGETQPAVTNCDCHVINSATRGVAVGSIEGDCDIYVDKVSLECKLTGSEGVVIGSLSGKKSAMTPAAPANRQNRMMARMK